MAFLNTIKIIFIGNFYRQFRIKWNLEITDISSKAYVDIKMALRNFNCPSVAQRNITQFNKEVCLYFFKDDRKCQKLH